MTGAMLDRGSSHDAFAILGAIALATERVRVGPLVANMMNRHPVQLAVAMSTLQSLSQGRAVLGIGSGPAPGSRFALEHEAIWTQLLDGPARIRRLIETIALVRLVWADGVNLVPNRLRGVEETRSVERIVLAVSSPFDLDALARIGDRLDVRS